MNPTVLLGNNLGFVDEVRLVSMSMCKVHHDMPSSRVYESGYRVPTV